VYLFRSLHGGTVVEQRNKGYWVSIVALITAIISLIAASIPLVSPFTFSWIEQRNKTSLLSLIPANIRSTCSTDTSEDFKDAAFSFECFPKGVTVLRVAQFKSSKGLYAHYNKAVKKARVPRGGRKAETDCTKKAPSEAPWAYSDSAADEGRKLCYLDNKLARMEWTNNEKTLYAYLIGVNSNFKSPAAVWEKLPF
jgi:hypothetical protein